MSHYRSDYLQILPNIDKDVCCGNDVIKLYDRKHISGGRMKGNWNWNLLNVDETVSDNELDMVSGGNIKDIDVDNECSYNNSSTDGTCSSNKMVQLMKQYIEKTAIPAVADNIPSDKRQIIETAKKVTKCDSESCILAQNDFIEFVGPEIVANEKKTSFKPYGPKYGTAWLNNFNIDETLQQFTKRYKYAFHIPFQMIDFQTTKTELATVDLYTLIKHGIKYVFVVLNTDKSNGRGEHWFSLFMDFSEIGSATHPWTLEYFNSSGLSPKHELHVWLHTTKETLSTKSGKKVEIIVVNNKALQMNNHACGVYSVHYIYHRLDGNSVEDYRKNNVNDSDMKEWRKFMFRNHA